VNSRESEGLGGSRMEIRLEKVNKSRGEWVLGRWVLDGEMW
jgi:hypothetical protein